MLQKDTNLLPFKFDSFARPQKTGPEGPVNYTASKYKNLEGVNDTE
jgi:hypothetical protein